MPRSPKDAPDGGRDLTFNDLPDLNPVWSPERRPIAFQSNRSGNCEVYVMSTTESRQAILTAHAADTRAVGRECFPQA